MKKIAIITSGGDAPGLNAAIHAAVITANKHAIEVIGVNDGYEGLIDGNFSPLSIERVRDIMDKGGTILHTSRSERFLKKKFRQKAYHQLKGAEIDGLLILGGNGSLKGAHIFFSETGFPVIGIPKTIDNDVYGTSYAIGFDTAVNTVVEAIDKIKDTADSTHRIFIIEVMGRKSGSLALHAGVAVGANAIIIPEIKVSVSKLYTCIEQNRRAGTKSMLIVVTENCLLKGTGGLKKTIDQKFPGLESRITVLGHVQRGGHPTAADRTLATVLGYRAFAALVAGKKGVMVGSLNGKIKFTALSEVADKIPVPDENLLQVAGGFSAII